MSKPVMRCGSYGVGHDPVNEIWQQPASRDSAGRLHRASRRRRRAVADVEAELGRLAQAQPGVRDRADLARQRDLAEPHRVARQRLVGQRRDQRRGHRQIGRRIGQAIAARDVEIDLGRGEIEPAARLQHRQQHRQPPAVPAHHRAARRRARWQPHDQRLDLDQHRPRAFERREHRAARHRLLAARQEQQRGVGDFLQPLPRPSRTRRSRRPRRSGS